MGAPPISLLDSLNMKDIVLNNKGTLSSTTNTIHNTTSNNNDDGLLWSNVIEAQRVKLSQSRRKHTNLRKNKRVLMKKGKITRSSQQGLTTRCSEDGIERKVRTLKKLVPNRESQGLDGLFRDTAAYIMSLQMRVRVMQVMVDVLEGSQDHH